MLSMRKSERREPVILRLPQMPDQGQGGRESEDGL